MTKRKIDSLTNDELNKIYRTLTGDVLDDGELEDFRETCREQERHNNEETQEYYELWNNILKGKG